MPPQNPVDRTIVDVSTPETKPSYLGAALAVRPARNHQIEVTGRRARLWYLAPFMAPATPERFGDYELVERLGVGGMAETFLAIRRGPGDFEQRVCLKRILPTFVNDAEFVAMFLREARLSALLHHGQMERPCLHL